MGVTDAVIHPLEIGDDQTHWTYDELRGLQTTWRATACVSPSWRASPYRTAFASDWRAATRTSRCSKQFLRHCGDLGIPVVCYDWMAGVRWARTEAHNELQGGSLATGYDNAKMQGGPAVDAAEKSHEDIFEALAYFLEEVVPVARTRASNSGSTPTTRRARNCAASPRRHQRGELRPHPRRLRQRVQRRHVLPGQLRRDGRGHPQAIRHFGEKINFVHFRDVDGDADRFVETWHDEGPTDMHAAMEAYVDAVDDEVPMRPDHVPTMAGEDNSNPGYHTKGRLWAIGYMRGLLDSLA